MVFGHKAVPGGWLFVHHCDAESLLVFPDFVGKVPNTRCVECKTLPDLPKAYHHQMNQDVVVFTNRLKVQRIPAKGLPGGGIFEVEIAEVYAIIPSGVRKQRFL